MIDKPLSKKTLLANRDRHTSAIDREVTIIKRSEAYISDMNFLIAEIDEQIRQRDHDDAGFAFYLRHRRFPDD